MAMSETRSTRVAPNLEPEPGWTPVEPPRLEGGRGSFVSGNPHGKTLRVAYFEDAAGGLVGRAWFGAGSAGPPGHAHGGAIAAVLDEAMGAAAWRAGHICVAANLDTDFRRMLPLGTDAYLEARVDGVEGRKVRTSGELLGEDGEPFAEARALFVTFEPERDRRMLERVADALDMDPDELLSRIGSARSSA